MVKEIDAKTTKKMVEEDDDVVLIDVLGEESYEKRHLPEAINIPVNDERFEEKVKEAVPSKETPVIVYCADPPCEASPKAAKKLEEMGYKNVHDFDAGLLGWRRAGYEYAEGTGPERLSMREL
ncbi:MAG: rhodanese-like domain-containing protein [Euryarchaeota archaeon]|nr:rhodanese-like domain-containing protein [Euryarchaeota archaeon]